VRDVLRVPAGAVLWREKRFEVIVGGEWVTGTFDRVVVASDRALIVDFKTDAVADRATAEERADGYRPQLGLYRQVLQLLTGLPASSIESVLIFTRLPCVVAVGPEVGQGEG
jgi:ATP-dependent helicase/nuclease subunit A